MRKTTVEAEGYPILKVPPPNSLFTPLNPISLIFSGDSDDNTGFFKTQMAQVQFLATSFFPP